MKNLKTVQMMVVIALYVLVPQILNAAPAGQWNAGGYTQWHSNDGQTPMGSVGTQCFFCKPDQAAPAKELNTGIAPVPAAQSTTPYNYGNTSTVKKKSAASSSVKKAAKKPAKKSAVAKKSTKKKAVAKKSGKKHAVHKKHAHKKAQHQKQVKKNPGYER
jgi:hypothetical protein